MRILLGAALVLALLYVGLAALVFARQRAFLFPGAGVAGRDGAPDLPCVEAVRIATGDGEVLAAWWAPPQPGRAVLLYFHGNGGTLADRRGRIRLLTEGGRGLLIVSYRGYPGSTGSPSEAGLRQDARAAYRWLSSYDPHRIVLYGESLGTGVAVKLATEQPVGGVILDAPYTSTAAIGQRLFPFLPVALLMRDQFRSIDRIGRLRVPLLVLTGEQDGVVPTALSEALFAAANEPKRFVRLHGVDHVSVLERGGLPPVRAFLDGIEAALPPLPPG